MSSRVCLTVDVEDFYDGMAVLGCDLARPTAGATGLEMLLEVFAQRPWAQLTLFVVGDYAPKVKGQLEALIKQGHEIASHGPDHGRLPDGDLVAWLAQGREQLEDLLGVAVNGFRSPRFDVPAGGLRPYRADLAQAGYRYVSDVATLGAQSPVAELPVLSRGRLRVGGGSYQRLLPGSTVEKAVERSLRPAVLYYHSYDFGAALPSLRSARSVALVKQLAGRGRIASVFGELVDRFGSSRCGDAC